MISIRELQADGAFVYPDTDSFPGLNSENLRSNKRRIFVSDLCPTDTSCYLGNDKRSTWLANNIWNWGVEFRIVQVFARISEDFDFDPECSR